MDEWTNKDGTVYRLDSDAPEGVVRYLAVEGTGPSKPKAKAKAKRKAKKKSK